MRKADNWCDGEAPKELANLIWISCLGRSPEAAMVKQVDKKTAIFVDQPYYKEMVDFTEAFYDRTFRVHAYTTV